MTGRRIKLHNGVTYEDSTCGYADGFLWCFIAGYTMQEVAGVFFDHQATSVILFEYGELADRYEGYTSVAFMKATENGCDICLVRPDDYDEKNGGDNE